MMHNNRITVLLVTTSMVGLWSQYCFWWYERNDSFGELADTFCVVNQGLICVMKLIYMTFMHNECYDLINSAIHNTLLSELEILFALDINCKQQLLKEMKQILDDSWLNIKQQVNLFAFLCLIACGAYMFPCLYFNYYYTYVQPQNFTLQLPLPALFPMWHDYGMSLPYYPIQYIITGTENSVCGISAICFDGLFIIVVGHCSALFEILHKLVEHATDEGVPKAERIKYLICCVRLHERIFRYYESINLLYRNPNLIQCFCSMLLLCVVMVVATVGLEEDIPLFLKMLCFLLAAGFQITIYCCNGQKVTTQSEKSASVWYSTSWYNESKQFKFIINMMIVRTKRTLFLQVSGFSTMSHMTLLSIVQSSASYYLFLQSLRSED